MGRSRGFAPLMVMTVLAGGAAVLGLEQSPAHTAPTPASARPGAPSRAGAATSSDMATVPAAGSAAGSTTTSPASPTTTTTVGPAVTLVGATLAQATAETLGTGRHLAVQVEREEVDTSVAPGTIISQGGTSGAGSPSPPPQAPVNVTVAVSPAPPCTATQVAMSYLGGQELVGNDLGFLVVRDVSDRWCSLNGPLQVWGQAATGRAVTNTLAEPVPFPIVLSPGARTPQPFIPTGPPGVLQAAVEVGAGNATCMPPAGSASTASTRVVPATFELSMPDGSTLGTANRSYGTEGLAHFVACGGRLLTSLVPAAVTVRG